MSYANTTISTISTEKEFVTAFITSITSVTNRITRTSTTATCEDIYDAGSGTPTFTLKVDNNFELVFTRSSSLSSGTDRFYLTVNNLLRGTQETTNFLGLLFRTSGTGVGYTQSVPRTWKFIIAANDKAVTLMLGHYSTDFSSNGVRLASVVDTVNATAYIEDDNLADSGIFYFSDGTSGTLRHRMFYMYDISNPAKVEIIRNKVALLRGVSPVSRANTLSGIYDCSNVSLSYIPITIGGVNYYAVNEFTLLPI